MTTKPSSPTTGRRARPTLAIVACTAALAAALGACSTAAPSRSAGAAAPPESARAALERGDWAAAQAPLAALLRRDLRNGYLQFLNALNYEQLAVGGDQEQRDLAAVGYENALQFTPQNYWAQLMAGYLQLQHGDYDRAQALFAGAALDQPQRWEAFYGLGVASYYRTDLPLLRLAAQRSLQLAPERSEALRLAAYALALEGDPQAQPLASAAARKAGLPADDEGARYLLRRVDELVQQNRIALADTAPEHGVGDSPTVLPQQMVADVTIILSSVVDGHNYGVNLFDSLQLQYGYGNTYTRQSVTTDTDGVLSRVRQSSRAITSGISIPQLTYSLNLFNKSNQYYGVVARPSLTAFLGRESEFFAGRTINVAVSGINVGDLQPIDVGVRLNLSPEEISRERVRFRVRAARSFLSRETVGSFQQSLTTFQQLVQTTAELEFGQTLILSALSESVTDTGTSKVPLLGDTPGLDLLFKNDNGLKRQETLLILVTPSLPTGLRLPPDAARRARGVQDLLRYWHDIVDPNSDVEAIVKRLQGRRPFRKPEPGDLPFRPAHAEELVREAVRENLRLAEL